MAHVSLLIFTLVSLVLVLEGAPHRIYRRIALTPEQIESGDYPWKHVDSEGHVFYGPPMPALPTPPPRLVKDPAIKRSVLASVPEKDQKLINNLIASRSYKRDVDFARLINRLNPNHAHLNKRYAYGFIPNPFEAASSIIQQTGDTVNQVVHLPFVVAKDVVHGVSLDNTLVGQTALDALDITGEVAQAPVAIVSNVAQVPFDLASSAVAYFA